MGKHLEILCLDFVECPSLTVGGVKEVTEIARFGGGEFLIIDRPKSIWVRDPDPLGNWDPSWGLFSKSNYSHPILEKETERDDGLKGFDGTASFSFYGKTYGLSQYIIWPLTPENAVCVAHGLLAYAQLFYPHLHPEFGFIDELGSNRPLDKNVKKKELRSIQWANFFGPAYVGKYGRKFLLDAPGWKKEELDDGGILYVVTESFFQWWTKPPREVLEYFQKQIPGIKLYRAKSSDY